VILGGGAVSYDRGTPVVCRHLPQKKKLKRGAVYFFVGDVTGCCGRE